MTTGTLELPATTPAGEARARVMAAPVQEDATPTSLVGYQSYGRVLVIGEEHIALAAARRLGDDVEWALLAPGEPSPDKHLEDGRPVIRGGKPMVEGYLGAFSVTLETDSGTVPLAALLGEDYGVVDLVLDLGDSPLMDIEVPPVGYYAPRDEAALERVLADLPEMEGEFEKPKYFNYDPSICAHGSSGLTGCTRCIEACPTQAIVSIGDKVEVNPYLCQGGGSCVAACPSGAMTYAYPTVADLLAHVRGVVETYREAAGSGPVVMFHDGWSRKALAGDLGARMPEDVIPVELEEIGSVGLEAWLACLAYGARAVVMLRTAGTPPRILRELEDQTRFAGAILAGMGYGPESASVLDAGEPEATLAALGELPAEGLRRPASFAAPDEKRNIIRMALDHLYRQAPNPRRSTELPAGAPFGQVKVDKKACTLCMSCVGVCPTAALQDGRDLPQLKFTEWNCVQCGLCEKACPEDAITLGPRLLYDADARQQTRLLHEEQPFCCVVCGKPFATQSVMQVMARKLEGHWMFQTERARRRLQMCEHCRVKDAVTEQFDA